MKVERVVVTSGPLFTDCDRVEADLRALLPLGLCRIAQGNGKGAEAFAANWARRWLRGGDGLAGYQPRQRRNAIMLEQERPDLMLVYPDTSGVNAWRCGRSACDRGITTIFLAPFVEVYDFMGEDDIKPAIYIDGPEGNIICIDDQRRVSHGRSSDGGWASLDLIEAPPRFAIATFDNHGVASTLLDVLAGAK